MLYLHVDCFSLEQIPWPFVRVLCADIAWYRVWFVPSWMCVVNNLDVDKRKWSASNYLFVVGGERETLDFSFLYLKFIPSTFSGWVWGGRINNFGGIFCSFTEKYSGEKYFDATIENNSKPETVFGVRVWSYAPLVVCSFGMFVSIEFCDFTDTITGIDFRCYTFYVIITRCRCANM